MRLYLGPSSAEYFSGSTVMAIFCHSAMKLGTGLTGTTLAVWNHPPLYF